MFCKEIHLGEGVCVWGGVGEGCVLVKMPLDTNNRKHGLLQT